MKKSNENPWCNLPQHPPYVLSEDLAQVQKFNGRRNSDHAHFLHINELLPEPFVGDADAPVILLSNNPGVGKNSDERKTPAFREMMRRNLHHKPSEHPFVYLDPEYHGGWWRSKLKELIELFGVKIVARSVLNIVYCPYPSRKFGHGKLALPSQTYSFKLVAHAVRRKAAIVRLRRGESIRKLWVTAVPELKDCPRFYRVNSQNAAVSRGNCNNFDDIVQAITASLK